MRHSTMPNLVPTMSARDETLHPTAILDFRSEAVDTALRRIGAASSNSVDYLRTCHEFLHAEVAPVYTVNELQPVSVTLTKRTGSCSQRFACLEALARVHGIGTRVRALWIDGRFWAPRFKFTHPFIPHRVLLALPQFYVSGDWIDVEELFGDTEFLARRNPVGFANNSESLFDAISHVAADFRGKSAACEGTRCDLSRFAVGVEAIFSSRDELFSRYPLFQNTIRGRVFELLYGGRKSA